MYSNSPLLSFRQASGAASSLIFRRVCMTLSCAPVLLSIMVYSTKGVIMRYEGSVLAFCTSQNNSRSFAITQDDIIVEVLNLQC